MLVLLLIVAFLFPVAGFAAEKPIKVTVDGKELAFPDGKPFKDEAGRVQVPIRIIGEALGLEVSWNQEYKMVGFKTPNVSDPLIITLTVGQDWYDMYGVSIEMDTTATIRDDRVYAPIRFISEAFGVGVQWDAKNNTVHLGGDAGEVPVKIKRFPIALSGGIEVLTGFNLSYTDHKGKDGKLVEFWADLNPWAYDDAYYQRVGEDIKYVAEQVLPTILVNSLMRDYIEELEPSYHDRRHYYFKNPETDQYIEVYWSDEIRNYNLYLIVYEKGFDPK